jgi:hypothetical protein
LLLAFFAHLLATGAGAVRRRKIRVRSHDGVRHLIRFALLGIVGTADRQLRLN